MGINYGQPPYFDNTTPDFDRIGDVVDVSNPESAFTAFKTIQFGGPFLKRGSRKYLSCLRRHIYQYTNNSFVFYKTYTGVRKLFQTTHISNVADVSNLNTRSLTRSIETQETEPVYVNQDLLNALFNFPSNNDYFFVEVSIDYFKASESIASTPKYHHANIYRYGKITQNNVIIVCKESGGDFMQKVNG